MSETSLEGYGAGMVVVQSIVYVVGEVDCEEATPNQVYVVQVLSSLVSEQNLCSCLALGKIVDRC